MEITITDRAIEELNKQIAEKEGMVKIHFDDENCGCAGGVPVLWHVNEPNLENATIYKTNDRPVFINNTQKVYFDEVLKIDYSDSLHSFQLKSPQQILNPVMPLVLK
ncbi:iron-sulfur cluster biosynthesis family protein [Caldibacillus lycopersici]|uniref:Iron-sulfur cluster biosynthesis family protein n=1 Tax=Perspicuibacillus lycopersici TaxID=1325689 RepID=A0AAE3LLY7_9BACI|nr:iron-sulfur cluster biosynthesis family protein [Perspicuibacillus lycopersici]MCU9612955.1 iron-sulfur cluster biosynthesis family protein [Perspicuibacillus lycopersici]